MYELLDPFDRSNICASKVYTTNHSILLEFCSKNGIASGFKDTISHDIFLNGFKYLGDCIINIIIVII